MSDNYAARVAAFAAEQGVAAADVAVVARDMAAHFQITSAEVLDMLEAAGPLGARCFSEAE